MGNFKARSKEEAGRELARIKKEIAKVVSSLDPMELVPLLLCLEDAVNNLEIMCIKSMRLEENLKNERLLAAFNFITEWYMMINDVIIEVVDNGHMSSTRPLTELPEFSFGICFEKDLDKHLRFLHEKGELDLNDMIFRKPRLFLNRIPGWFYLAVKGKIDRRVAKKITTIFNLRDLFYRKGLLETMIYISPDGTKIEFNDTGLRKISLPKGVTVESVFEQQGITPRLIETYTGVFDWNSFFREIATENLKNVEFGRGEDNIDRLRHEDEEIYKAYDSIKNYSKIFQEFYGIEFKTFFNIVSEMTYLCCTTTHTLGYWKFPDLLRDKQLKRFNSDRIKQVVSLLSESTKQKKRYDGFIILDDMILTSFRRLTASRLIIMEKCYSEVLNNDLRGKAFEEACRKMVQNSNFETLPRRVNVREPTISYEISFPLWGKQKQRTDFDVVASQNNSLLAIECKEIKSHKLRSRDEKQFKKYLVEHFFKTMWIINNVERFEHYIGGTLHDMLSVDTNQPIYVFPILVTNIPVQVEGIKETPLVTYLELKDIASMKGLLAQTKDNASGTIEVDIKNRRISLPWLSVKEQTAN